MDTENSQIKSCLIKSLPEDAGAFREHPELVYSLLGNGLKQKPYCLIITGLIGAEMNLPHPDQIFTALARRLDSSACTSVVFFLNSQQTRYGILRINTSVSDSAAAAEAVHAELSRLLPERYRDQIITSVSRIYSSADYLHTAYAEALQMYELSYFHTGMTVISLEKVIEYADYVNLTSIQTALKKIRILLAESTFAEVVQEEDYLFRTMIRHAMNIRHMRYADMYLNNLFEEYMQVYHIRLITNREDYLRRGQIALEDYAYIYRYLSALTDLTKLLFTQMAGITRYSADIVTALYLMRCNLSHGVTVRGVAEELSISPPVYVIQPGNRIIRIRCADDDADSPCLPSAGNHRYEY